MTVLAVLLVWGALTCVALLGAAAVCRSGHVEDVARGFAEDQYPVGATQPGG